MKSEGNDLIDRRFFLSNIPSAPRLFCCNTVNGFTFGEISFENEDLLCQSTNIYQEGFQINHLSWLPNTIFRSSRKQISIGCTTLPITNHKEQASLIYNNESHIKWLDETSHLTPSSIDHSESFNRIAVSHLNGTVKIYDTSKYNLFSQSTFTNDGILHQLKWNPIESHLLLLAHQNRLNIFDAERKSIGLTLGSTGKEHLADCTWKDNDVIIGRHRQEILVWDKRVNREPIRRETLDKFGVPEKLKCSLASPNHLLAVYDSRLAKIKIYDFRFLTMRQVESFDDISSAFLDYHWTIDQMAILVATHQGLLHWIDVDVPTKSKRRNH